jgi:ribonuclease III
MTNFNANPEGKNLSEANLPQPPTWQALQQRLGHHFADPALLAQALTHRSFANESRDPSIVDNERLEFLGDAVLDLIIGHQLFADHPGADEGELSRLRAELVSAPTLARLAGELALGECLLLGRGAGTTKKRAEQEAARCALAHLDRQGERDND